MRGSRKSVLFAASVIFISFAICPLEPVRAQQGTDTKIIFGQDLEERAREQLQRLLSRYDLDPWIFTREVKIEAGEEPHSMPVLTLNTDFLDDDEMQLSIFLHEQAHWFVYEAEARDAAIDELRQMYPEPPNSHYRTYQHLLVAWVELDAMAELIGEPLARQVLEAKVERLSGEPVSDADVLYRWYNGRVLSETAEIGRIAAKHDMNITPEKGLIIDAKPESTVSE